MDHIVLRVADVERSVAWYRDLLGLAVEQLEEWRAGQAFFPSVRVSDDTIIDILAGDRSGENVDHLCLLVEPTDLQAVRDAGELDVVEGPVARSGAHGVGTSIYVRDPDHNLVELKHYGG
jgi:catechol 2,3-dioxygenase-like lactoylglutathione lyase family enzyme